MPFISSSFEGDEDAFSDLSCDIDDLLSPGDATSRTTNRKSILKSWYKPRTRSDRWLTPLRRSSLSRRRNVQLLVDTSKGLDELHDIDREHQEESPVADEIPVPQPLRWRRERKKALPEVVDKSYKGSSGPEPGLLRPLSPVSPLSWSPIVRSSPVSAISNVGSLREAGLPEPAVAGQTIIEELEQSLLSRAPFKPVHAEEESGEHLRLMRNSSAGVAPTLVNALKSAKLADQRPDTEDHTHSAWAHLEVVPNLTARLRSSSASRAEETGKEVVRDIQSTGHKVKGKQTPRILLQEMDTRTDLANDSAQDAQGAPFENMVGVASKDERPLWLQDELCLPVGFFSLPGITAERQAHFELAYGRLIGAVSDSGPCSEKPSLHV